MTDYNVWRTDTGTWVKNLDVIGKGMQDPSTPYTLTYIEAREVLEYFRLPRMTMESVEVRVLTDGITPGDEAVGYNVWVHTDSGAERWTLKGEQQDPNKPIPWTYSYAEEIRGTLDSDLKAVIMEIGADLKPQPIFGTPKVSAKAPAAPIATPITPAEPAEGAIDFDAYNGFTGGRVYGMRQLHQDVQPLIDPYTGLPRNK